MMSVNRSLTQTYRFPNHCTTAHACYTNTPSKTAVRGPGELQAACIIESVIDRVAMATGRSSHEIRVSNMIGPSKEGSEHSAPCGDVMWEYTAFDMWKQLEKQASFEERLEAVNRINSIAKGNEGSIWPKKRGIAMTPLKYHHGVSGRMATVHIYKDGSVVLSGVGVEIGQGLFTKVAQAAAYSLSQIGVVVPLDMVRHADSSTELHPNIGMTGGSTTSEACAAAVHKACGMLVKDLSPVFEKLKAKQKGDAVVSWSDIARAGTGIGLTATARWGPTSSKDPLAQKPEAVCGEYENYAAACSEVEIDTLTGECSILRTDILYDCGRSLNPCIDLGQAEGAFMHGVGMLLREEMVYVPETGEVFTEGTWEYKPPCTLDVPRVFHVHFLENSEFKRGFLGSKSSGEPPLVCAASVYAAIRMAITAARPVGAPFFSLDVPCTVDRIALACRG